LKSEIFYIFVASVLIIFLVVFKLTDVLVKRIEESEVKQQMNYREVEHTNKLASIGRLAAGVAHEINNPLAIINEKSGLMEDLIGSASDFPRKEKFLQLTESIRQSVDRCSTITHRLLGFARRMDIEIEMLDLNEVVFEVYGFLEREAFHRDIEVQLQLSDNLSKISSDHGQLQQVFLNILNNAFAAVDDGGAVIIKSWENKDDTVGVSIQDNGIGMSEETEKHIFEPFFSGRTGHGTGLGLSITYGIVDKLGGRIEVESEEGQGTTFTVLLPKTYQKGNK
jgi:two-component system NtrC family sensor kinase